MKTTPKSLRLHIGIFGRRNVGKSSLLNAITRQQTAIVSAIAGTTTDPIEKPMEFLPLGPVMFIDTAGIDDIGTLGALRIEKTRQIFDRVDIGILLTEANVWGDFEKAILQELMQRQVPIIIALNKIDVYQSIAKQAEELVTSAYPPQIKLVTLSAKTRSGLDDLRQALIDIVPSDFINTPIIIRDLVGKGELAILVTPIDKEAPKGRLIMPEVQTIRDVLDGDALCIVTQQTQLKTALVALKSPPKLVVTDSQCFAEVAAITPVNIPLTSFSILFARFKGDIMWQTEGVAAIDKLQVGDRVVICEACTHHPIQDDIGRETIPKLLQKYVGGSLNIDIFSGHDFPTNLTDYKLVIHCGACMLNRREVLSRILHCRKLSVPCTNYGLTIAHCLGILPRALSCFPKAQALYEQLCTIRANK
jgi:[FeFe] hydrogenase H-cluster maturation GTPase HydF